MSILAKIKSHKNKKISKKALSIVVGYVLLIVFAVIIGVMVYKWQKTYVPQDEYAACPEGASLFIVNKSYDCDSNILKFAVKNNGQFAVGGYFVYIKDDSEKTIATVEVSNNNTEPRCRLDTFYGIKAVKLGIETFVPALNNSFEPGEVEIEEFDLTHLNDNLYGIEIVPIRWQKEGNKDVLASCKENKISEDINGCSAEQCEDDGQACVGRECGTMMNNCYEYVECGEDCGDGSFCDSTGHCVTPENCDYTCDNLGYICGYHTICGVERYCGTSTPEEDCPSGYYCDEVNGHCILDTFTCNGYWEGEAESPGIECDDSLDPNCNEYCYCVEGYDPDGTGGCELIESGIPQSCPAVCNLLGYLGDPRIGDCEQNQAQCNSYCNLNGGSLGGILEPSGDEWCEGGPTSSCCCCLPQA